MKENYISDHQKHAQSWTSSIITYQRNIFSEVTFRAFSNGLGMSSEMIWEAVSSSPDLRYEYWGAAPVDFMGMTQFEI